MLARLRMWWNLRTGEVGIPWEKDLQFWIVNLAIHLVALILMGKWFLRGADLYRVTLSAASDELVEIVELPPPIQFDEMKFEEAGEVADGEVSLAPSESEVIEEVNEAPIEISLPDPIAAGELMDIADAVTFEEGMVTVPVKGQVGVAATGAAGAVDRITQEILLSLEERPTTVVWLFDQSASLITQREEIRGRFDRIYRELQNLAAADDDGRFSKLGSEPLLSTVYSFGSNFNRLLPEPTTKTDELLGAIDRIQRDDTGLEYVFSTVIQAVTDFKKFRKLNRLTNDRPRNVMIIIVSDEAGDDVARLDEAVQACNQWQIPVYVVGIPAPFGREETQVRWVDPDPNFDQTPQWAVVSQGPETLMSELIKLDFTPTDFEDLEMIDSGFGPFGLTRLAYETGGIYFAVHPNRRTDRDVGRGETANYTAYLRHFFDPDIMKRYKPDYVSHATYMQRLTANKARMALVQAANLSRVGNFEAPNLRFPRFDEAQFIREVSLAQRSAALLEPKLNQLYEVLRTGEADRENELAIRWRAGFDLAYGRVLANKIRAEAFNGMLAMAKTKLKFEKAESNTWVLRPADTIQTGSQAATMAEKARQYLNRVREEHPGTPWAMLAERELQTPIGWVWEESFTEPPRPPEMEAGNNNPNNFNPQPMQNANPPPRRAPPKL